MNAVQQKSETMMSYHNVKILGISDIRGSWNPSPGCNELGSAFDQGHQVNYIQVQF